MEPLWLFAILELIELGTFPDKTHLGLTSNMGCLQPILRKFPWLVVMTKP